MKKVHIHTLPGLPFPMASALFAIDGDFGLLFAEFQYALEFGSDGAY